MKRARFRLDSILRLREEELSLARSTLAERLRAQGAETAERDRWLEHVSRGVQTLEAGLESGLPAGAAQVTNLAIEASRAAEKAATSRLRVQDESVANARSEVTEAKRRVRALEIVRTRFQASEKEREAKRAQRDLDEIASRVYSRRRR